MKNKVRYFVIMLFLFMGIAQLKAQDDITLTITLDVAFDMNTQVEAPATVYDNINAAIAAAFTALGGGETLETHGQYVKKLILNGSAPYSHYDLRGIRNTFCSGLAATATTFNNVEEIDMSNALLVSDKLQAPLQWSTNKYTENSYASIEAGAFAYLNNQNSKLKKVILPSTLVNIGGKVFGRCKSLEAIELPESLTGSIGNDAFNSCVKLTIPNGLPEGMSGSLGAGAFDGCSSLALTTLPAELGITGDATYIFRNCPLVAFSEINGKIVGNDTKRRYFTGIFENTGVSIKEIPEGIYTVGGNAFYKCANIDTITFPETMGKSISGGNGITSSIGAQAFALPAGSEVQRVYIFKSENPPVGGTAADAFNKGTAIDPDAIVYVPNAAAVEAFKAVTPYDQMNVYKIINTITVDAGENGTVTTTYGTINEDGTIDVKKGDDITFSFTANYGYEIAKVFVNDAEVTLESDGTYTLQVATVDQDYTIAVEYARNVFTVSIDNDDDKGTVTTEYGDITESTIDVNINDDITFSFAANYGYEISKVLVDDEEVTLTDGAYTLTDVTGDHAIAVEYARNVFTVSIDNDDDKGTVTTEYGDITEGAIDVNINDDITFTFAANYGYEISKVLVDDEEVTLTDGAYTLTDVTGDHAIAVEYARNVFTITVNASEKGTVTTTYGTIENNRIDVSKGENITFTLTPEEKCRIDQVQLDDVDITLTEENTYTLDNVTQDHTLRVTFTDITALLPTEKGAISVYPNPATDEVRMDGTEKGARIRLFNPAGKLLQETQETVISLSGYPQGVYFIKVNGNVTKIIKK
jgi:hypothetical protein